MKSTGSSRIRPRDPLAQFEQDAGTRFVDLRIVVGRKKTREILFAVGGRWDRALGRYTEEPAERCKVIWLNEAQCLGESGNKLEEGPAWSLKTWIEARRAGTERLGELVLDGPRGSGKTVLGTIAVFLIAIEFPGARGLLIPPANTRRHEIDVIVKEFIPRRWRAAWSQRDMTFTLPNGSTVTYVGADDEDALKQGGFEVALLNEAQLMSSQAYVNAAGGIRNLSGRPMGLLMLAMNYASKERGEWTNDHLDKIDGGLKGAQHYKLDPKLNEFVDEGANDIAAGLARSVRPDLAALDFDGIRKRLGDMAAPAFKPHRLEFGGHVGKPPADWVDVTAQVTAKKTDTRKGFLRVVSMDFQRRPGCVAGIFRLYRRPDGEVVYWCEKYIVAGDNEDDLCRLVDEYLEKQGLTAREALAVCDSTGRFQNAAHTKNTKPSHDIVREWYFTVVAPKREKKRGGWGIGNPDVDDSLSQFYDICQENRFIVSDEAEWLVESLRRCKTKKRGGSLRLDDKAPGYSHGVDISRYVTWYFEPRRGLPGPQGIDTKTADTVRDAARGIFSNR